MARIFVNAVSMGIGGNRTYLYEVLKNCAEVSQLHEYCVLLPRSGISQSPHLTSRNVSILPESYRVPEARWRRALWEQLVLPFVIRRYDVDALMSVGSVDVFIASGLMHVPSVVVVQINQPWMVPNLLPSKYRVAYLRAGMSLAKRTARYFVVVSETAKQELCQAFDIERERVSVIYHGGASEIFSPEAQARQGMLDHYGITKPYILSVSSVFTFKNHHRLVEAYAIVRKRFPNAPRLLIVGAVLHRSYFAEIEQLVDSLGVRGSVCFLGHVPHDDLPAIYANAELYVFPSLCETFGLTQLEAMACGVPVIASNVSVMPEICGDAAEYFDPYVPDDIAEAILKIIVDKKRKRELVAKGFQRVRAFSWEKTAKQTIELLEEVARVNVIELSVT